MKYFLRELDKRNQVIAIIDRTLLQAFSFRPPAWIPAYNYIVSCPAINENIDRCRLDLAGDRCLVLRKKHVFIATDVQGVRRELSRLDQDLEFTFSALAFRY